MTIPEAPESDREPPAPVPAPAPATVVYRSPGAAARLAEPWQALKMNFAVLLGAPQTDPTWLARLAAAADRQRQLTAQDPDVGLYMMLQTATHDLDHYSAHHAMYCALVVDLCAAWFEWPSEEATSLFHAALTMNIGMRSLQDAMANQAGALSGDQRKRIDEHATQSADLLSAAGVTDALWLETVRRHHRPILEGESSEPLQPAQRLAQLLQRADVFTAKLSRRKARVGASATVAARDACLDATGLPDAIGATMLRVLGLYPPGSYVRLASQEWAVVIRRGAKAHTPIVACLRRADGTAISQPSLRDTSDAKYSVQRGVLTGDLKIVLHHERVLGAR